MSDCTHPEETVEWRKSLSGMSGVRFVRQCFATDENGDECLEIVGKPVKPRDVPLEIDLGEVHLRKFSQEERRQKARGSFNGPGNSRRRKYEAYLRSSAWRGRGGVREIVLARAPKDSDGNPLCEDCLAAAATDVAHITYPRDIRDTRPEDCKASCSECNQDEKRQRTFRRVMGD